MIITTYGIIAGVIFGLCYSFCSAKIGNFSQDPYKIIALGMLAIFWPITILRFLIPFLWKNFHEKK